MHVFTNRFVQNDETNKKHKAVFGVDENVMRTLFTTNKEIAHAST